MMRLQRVGRKNDPTFRIVVTDKRTGPKSNKNVDILGSYNPKMNHVQIDADRAKDWLSKGVQPSDTVHNILVGQKVIEAPKKNVLPKKSPIVDENAAAEEEGASDAEASTEEGDAPADDAPTTEEVKEEPTAEESKDEAAEDAPAEEVTEEEKKD